MRVADLEIDLAAHRARRGGRRIELTAKEFALLECFALHPDEVLDRAAITAHVWDENHDPFTNVLEVLVRRLRRKIDDGFEPKLIHTHARRGLPAGRVRQSARLATAHAPSRRLTAWYAATFGLILLLLGGGLYAIIHHAAHPAARRFAQRRDARAGPRGAHSRDGGGAPQGQVVDAVDELHIPDRQLYLLDSAGRR